MTFYTVPFFLITQMDKFYRLFIHLSRNKWINIINNYNILARIDLFILLFLHKQGRIED